MTAGPNASTEHDERPSTGDTDDRGDSPSFGMAITTVGRWDSICRLLDDLAAQSVRPAMVSIAYDDNVDAAEGLKKVHDRYSDVLTIRTVIKHGGSTAGHNTAAAQFTDDVDWIYLLTDNCRLEHDFLERLSAHCTPTASVCAARLVDADGDRNTLPPADAEFTRRNAWSVVVPSMAIRRTDYMTVGGFDDTIGSGADSPWQSGDETDLVLRLAELDDFSIRWAPDIVVRGHTDFTHLTPAERRRKLRNYGRGTGFIYRRWGYPVLDKLRLLAGAATLPLRKRRKFRAGDGLALLIGRTEGLLGRKLSRDRDHRAVLR
jgi:GT2 family glycosyltransferase